jgi:hypothetical protein
MARPPLHARVCVHVCVWVCVWVCVCVCFPAVHDHHQVAFSSTPLPLILLPPGPPALTLPDDIQLQSLAGLAALDQPDAGDGAEPADAGE